MSKRAGKLPRGIRNNNPGNIEYRAKTQWKGQLGSDGRFIKFKSPEYGIRAIVRVIKTYQSKHKLYSIQEIINRWAPPFENDTRSYINKVANDLGVKPNAEISVNDADTARALVKAIIAHENGSEYEHYYSQSVINQGLSLAGIAIKNKTTAAKAILTSKRSGAAAVGAAATVTGALDAVNQVNQALRDTQALGSTATEIVGQLHNAERVIWVIAAVALGAFATVIWTKYHDTRRGR